MKRKFLTLLNIGILTLCTFTTTYAATSHGHWKYEYENGQLVRKFVSEETNSSQTPTTPSPSKSSSSTPSSSLSSSEQKSTSSRGHWAYEYENGQLVRKFVREETNPSQTPTTPSPSKSSSSTSSHTTPVTSSTPNSISSSNQETHSLESLSSDEKRLFNMINEERKNAGLSPVQLDPQASYAAQLKSKDIATHHYFSHESPTYGNVREMMKNLDIDFSGAAENLGMYGSVSRAHRGLMASNTHKQNILGNGWTHVGIGIEKNQRDGGIIVTEIFLRK